MGLYKKLFLLVLFALLLIVGVEFISSNNVELPIKLFSYTTNPLPLYLIIFLSFIIGLVLLIIFMFLGITRQELKIIRQSRLIRKLEEKLRQLEGNNQK
jgi:uncharacterized integral membrane protein